MPRAGFLYEYGRPAGAARARVNRDSRNELMELHATQKVCHRRAPPPRSPALGRFGDGLRTIMRTHGQPDTVRKIQDGIICP